VSKPPQDNIILNANSDDVCLTLPVTYKKYHTNRTVWRVSQLGKLSKKGKKKKKGEKEEKGKEKNSLRRYR